MQLLFRTLKHEFHHVAGTSPYDDLGSQRFLYSIWHDELLIPTFGGEQRSVAALVSQHQDGTYLADALEFVGLETVRGSSTRGGVGAIRELIKVTKRCHVVITPDGPQGPRQIVKSGIVFMAAKTGVPIVPTAFSASRCWRVRGSWTDLMIPKPFSTIYFVTAEPIHVSKRVSREELDLYATQVQQSMDRLQQVANHLKNGTSIADSDPDLKIAA